MENLTVLGLLLLLIGVDMPAEVHIPFYGTARDNQIGVPLCVDSRDVVLTVVSSHVTLAQTFKAISQRCALGGLSLGDPLAILGEEVGVVCLPHHPRRLLTQATPKTYLSLLGDKAERVSHPNLARAFCLLGQRRVRPLGLAFNDLFDPV